MSIKKIFKSTLPHIRYIFKDGKNAVFVNNVYMTSDENEIAELMKEIGEEGFGKSKHPHVYVDTGERELDSNAMSPLDIIKQKAREEALAEIRAEQARNMGDTIAKAALSGIGNTATHSQVDAKPVDGPVVDVNHDKDLNPEVVPITASTGTGVQTTATLNPAITAKPVATIVPKKV